MKDREMKEFLKNQINKALYFLMAETKGNKKQVEKNFAECIVENYILKKGDEEYEESTNKCEN